MGKTYRQNVIDFESEKTRLLAQFPIGCMVEGEHRTQRKMAPWLEGAPIKFTAMVIEIKSKPFFAMDQMGTVRMAQLKIYDYSDGQTKYIAAQRVKRVITNDK
jgi:hypothetical protein